MKKVTLLTLFITLITSVMAQSMGFFEPYSNTWMRRPGIYGYPVGQDDNNLYFFVSPRAIDAFKPKTWTDHVFTIDKNSLQSSEITITAPNYFTFIDGLVSDNSIIALYYSYNKKGDNLIFSISNIDKSAKSVTIDDNNSVRTTSNPKFWPTFEYSKSPDGKLLAALVMITGKNNQLENLFAVVVNDQGEFVWSGTITPDFGGKTFSIGDLTVDNEGNLYIPAYTCLMTGKNVSNVSFMVIKANADGTNSFTEEVNFGTPQDFISKILKDGNLVIGGYYTDSKTNTSTKSTGYFFYKFDTRSESFLDMQNAEFSDGYVEKEQWARFSNILGNQQYTIHADDIFELENGTLVLCGEHRFIKEIYNSQMHSYSYQHLTKNILVSKLLPDNSNKFTMIEKQQSCSMNSRAGDDWKPMSISYSAFAHGNDMYFLFNDDSHNIPYPGRGSVFGPSGLSFSKKGESVLMRLTPDQELTQRILSDPNQFLRGVEYTDGEYFYASGVGKSKFFFTKYSINE
jgi:hypothetical protein